MKKNENLKEFLIKKWMHNSLICLKIYDMKEVLILLLSLTDPDILKQSKFTDDERNLLKNLALENLHHQKCLKEYFALQLLE